MTHILAVGHAATSVSTVTITGVTWFWLIIAAAAGARFSWLAPVGIVVVYLLLHAHAAHTAVHASVLLLWVVIALVAGIVGWQLGGRAILRHVGEREYRNRLSHAKGISSIWKWWSGDSE